MNKAWTPEERRDMMLMMCPAEWAATICPMECPPDCASHMDEAGRQIDCWVVVMHQMETRLKDEALGAALA
jgi:hypothetical protein